MNISSTFSSTLGTFENGLFFKLVHNPLSIKMSLTLSFLSSKFEGFSMKIFSSLLSLHSITKD